MKTKHLTLVRDVFAVVLIALLSFNIAVAQTLDTDQDDYAPNSTATFTGTGFGANETVELIIHNVTAPICYNGLCCPYYVNTDANGDFNTTWTVCNCPGTCLRATATGQTSSLSAEKYFTDAAPATDPPAQAVPYTQNFSALLHTSTTYPVGWAGWQLSTAGSSTSFRTNNGTADLALIPSGTSTSTTGGVYNYNGKLGMLASGSVDPSLCFVVNTTGLTTVNVSYNVMTIRNPYDGGSNTRINEVVLQYRIGTTGSFTTLLATVYSNNTSTQTSPAVTTPQNSQLRSLTLPVACSNQSEVQLRWAQRDVSGAGSRASFAFDNISVTGCSASITIGGPTTFCTGGSVTLTASSGASYLWSTSATTQIISVSSSGNYTVQVTYADGCVATSSPVAVTVNTYSPSINLFTETMGSVAATTAIAAHAAALGFDNDGFTFTGTADVRNTTASSGYTGASGNANIFFTNTTGRVFEIGGINSTGLSAMQLSFGINKSTTAGDGSDFLIEVSSDGTTYTPLTFPALPTGSGTAVWAYRTTTGTIPAASNLRIRFTQLSTTTQYRIDDVSVTGNSTLTTSGVTTFCSGGSVTLSARSVGSYLWSTSSTTQSITVGVSGNYSVIVSDVNGCSSTLGPILVTVNTPPVVTCPGTISIPSEVGLCSAVATFSATATGFPVPSISYSQNSGTSFNVGTTVVNVSASNVCGSSSCTFDVTVALPCPVAYAATNAPVCVGTTLALFGDNLAAGQSSGNSYSWTGPLGTYSGQNPVVGIASLLHSGIYTVTVTNSCGCSASATVNVIVNPNPILSVGPVTNASCVGASDGCIDINASNGASPYLFDYLGDATLDGIYCGLAAGTYNVTVIDDNGCESNINATVIVQDIVFPTITCPGNISVSNTPGQCGATVTYATPTASDNCTGYISGQETGLPSSSFFPVGTTTNSFVVVDASGNSATCSFTVTVNDAETPTVSCPGNISVSNDPNSCNAVVTYNVSFGDNCSGSAIAQLTGFASGNSFPKGTTTNTFKVTDASGNTATCTFDVTVNDTENPTITCPGNISDGVNNTSCSRIVTYTVSYGDNCSGATLIQLTGLASGSAFPKGITTNSFRVTDASGNTATCSFTVTVTSSLSVNAGADEQTFYGYVADQTVTRTALASGGGGTYSYSWSLSRPLMCNIINSNGDESFIAGTCSNNICPGSGSPASAPSCFGNATVTSMLIEDADIYITVTDQYQCIAKDTFRVNSEDARCFAGNSGVVKVKICHHTSSTTNPWVQICIGQSTAPTHLSENPLDCIGTCPCGTRLDNATSNSDFGMVVYPNPSNMQVNIEFNMDIDNNYELSIFDITGKVVLTNSGRSYEGGNRITLPVQSLAEGIYNLRLNVGGEFLTVRLVVAK